MRPQPDEAEVERALWSLRAYDTIALATAGDTGAQVAAFFFVPERAGSGLQLLIAMPSDSRKLREIESDSRVGFMCYPGNAARWITGRGTASRLPEGPAALGLTARLLAHAPGARSFIEASDVTGVQVAVRRLNIVDALDAPPRALDF